MPTLIDELARRFAEAQGDPPRKLTGAQWTAVAVSVVRGLGATLTSVDRGLHEELIGLVREIKTARDEIAALRAEDRSHDHIMTANDELDAIVQATETATNQIMTNAETVGSIAAGLPEEVGNKLTEAVTQIFEACSFQDITGQRVAKVVKALHHIEDRVQRMVAALGVPPEDAAATATPAPGKAPSGPKGDADLLNGPALEGHGRSQAEIDALLGDMA